MADEPGGADAAPLVSIVLPTYKRARLLPHAIRSVLAQSHANLELIVVDDNSPDDTAAVVQSFTDPRIRYVKNDPNLKLPRALNRGFALARGEFLTWTSDDNLYAETAIEKMVARLAAGDCGLVYADYYQFAEEDAAGRPLDLQHERLPDRLQLEKGNHIGACFMYTRAVYEAVGDYDPELFLVEDYDYFMRIARGFKSCHIAEPLYYFRRDDNTLFCSRFCEVKASDFLVRYKNGLIDEVGVLNAVVNLVLNNATRLHNPVLHWSRQATAKLSYRLSQLHRQFLARHLHQRLSQPVAALLARYRTQGATFGEIRNDLMALMQSLGRIEYK